MHADPDADWPRRWPRLDRESPLNIQSRHHRVVSVHEDGEPTIAFAPWADVNPIVLSDGLVEQHVVASESDTHCLIGLLPQCGAAFHVGEEEGHGPARQVGHARAPPKPAHARIAWSPYPW